MARNETHLCELLCNSALYILKRGFSGGLVGKESACNAGVAGDIDLIPGSERSPGGGHGSSRQYSYLENLMDRRVWRATVHGVTKSQI